MIASSLLSVNNLTMRFGGLTAVDNVSFSVAPQEIFTIIGPNGAGKTTVFNCIGGFYKPTTGSILIQNKRLDGLNSFKVARQGLVRTFQNVRLFKNLTALENLLVAQHRQLKTNFFSGIFNTKGFQTSEKRALERAIFWLDFMGMKAFANRMAGNLAYGHQRRLEIARCMITNPRILLLDEPAAGLNPQEKIELQHMIRQLRDTYHIGVLLIEHDMQLVMQISDRILVMEYGRPIAVDVPEHIQTNERVIKAYLGEE